LLAFAGSLIQSPNQEINAGVRTSLYCSGLRLLGFPFGAKNSFILVVIILFKNKLTIFVKNKKKNQKFLV
jgi:hypothetical protein